MSLLRNLKRPCTEQICLQVNVRHFIKFIIDKSIKKTDSVSFVLFLVESDFGDTLYNKEPIQNTSNQLNAGLFKAFSLSHQKNL